MSSTVAVDHQSSRRRAQLREAADRYFAALAARRIEDVPYAADVVLRSPLAPPDAGIPYEAYPLRGRDAVQGWFRSIYPLLGPTTVIAYYYDETLTTIATRADVSITSPPSVLRVVDRFTVNDLGEIVEQENHYDPRPVLQGSRAGSADALTLAERELLVEMLAAGRDALVATLEGVTPELWACRPAPDAWSIADCTEHLVVSDEALLAHVRGQILSSPADPARQPEVRGKDGTVVSAMRDRTSKAKTFDFLEPRGRFADRRAALEAFEQARTTTMEYVRTTDDGLHDHFAPLGGLGDLDGYQWLLLIAAHTERHVAQIAEIKRKLALAG
jgi:hypothetical protein